MLLQSPILQLELDAAIKKYHDTIYQVGTITENNFESDPSTRELKARTDFSTDLMQAITKFIENTVFTALPASVVTVGSAITQSNVLPVIISKK